MSRSWVILLTILRRVIFVVCHEVLAKHILDPLFIYLFCVLNIMTLLVGRSEELDRRMMGRHVQLEHPLLDSLLTQE